MYENQPLRTLPKDIRQLLEEVISEPKKNIDRKDQGSPKSPWPALGPAWPDGLKPGPSPFMGEPSRGPKLPAWPVGLPL
ncbi:hypothetical protein CK203_105564 [Vitis vinifera]|uniref:Uncharacterized protein n=1 Tax=Vitis vinifera TaxID=29760 RepID=A0A438BXQ2_VITVI|nr:hypothetical protein CK203_105564 [Vitis vinifera]